MAKKRVYPGMSVEVDGPPLDDLKKRVRGPTEARPVRVKTSSFHITVNTNQRYGSKDAIIADMEPLFNAMKDVFGKPDNVIDIVEIMNEGDDPHKVIGDVKTDVGIEYSPKAGLHAHALMTLHHRTKLRIDLPHLRRLLDKEMPHLAKDAPHVFVRFVPDQKSVVQNYIYKTVGDVQYRLKEGGNFSSPMTCTCECKIADMTPFFSD